MSQRDIDKSFFVVWLINQVARAWGMNAPTVYRLLQKGDIVDEYILPFFDQLHSMGSEALIDDVTGLARKKGLLT